MPKSTRVEIIIAYNDRIQTEPGVWENNLIEKKVKAHREYVSLLRQDFLYKDKQQLTFKFRVRQHLVPKTDLDYVLFHGHKYKVRQIIPNIDNHYCMIECGELI